MFSRVAWDWNGCFGLILAQAYGLVDYSLPLGQVQGLVGFQVFGLRVKSRAGCFFLGPFYSIVGEYNKIHPEDLKNTKTLPPNSTNTQI